MKRYIPFLFIGSVLFTACGDKVFPGAVGQASFQFRNSINDALIGAFPSWRPKTNPYERTEKQLEKEQQRR
ncbi:MAG: hypothetical protein EAZ76_04460 [Nostocales cyanobacterium]|nr:MAG: hypothetical protein EAZ87_00765 [Nostocales cyanobacterium]TAF18743.1 MAG: hypothetical protein EAZ76_04460 [Nostocales cyanobacterium]